MNHLQEQAKKLVGQMTLLEKATLCTGATYWTTAAVERLGLHACVLSDGPHGVRKVKGKDHLGCLPMVFRLSESKMTLISTIMWPSESSYFYELTRR